MNIAIFLDDVTAFNGPLMFIPGSHKKGVVDAKHDTTTTSYPLWTVDHDLIAQMVEKAGGRGHFDEKTAATSAAASSRRTARRAR